MIWGRGENFVINFVETGGRCGQYLCGLCWIEKEWKVFTPKVMSGCCHEGFLNTKETPLFTPLVCLKKSDAPTLQCEGRPQSDTDRRRQLWRRKLNVTESTHMTTFSIPPVVKPACLLSPDMIDTYFDKHPNWTLHNRWSHLVNNWDEFTYTNGVTP